MTKYVYTYLHLEIGEMGEMDEIVEMVEIGCHFAHFARATSLLYYDSQKIRSSQTHIRRFKFER